MALSPHPIWHYHQDQEYVLDHVGISLNINLYMENRIFAACGYADQMERDPGHYFRLFYNLDVHLMEAHRSETGSPEPSHESTYPYSWQVLIDLWHRTPMLKCAREMEPDSAVWFQEIQVGEVPKTIPSYTAWVDDTIRKCCENIVDFTVEGPQFPDD